MVAEEIPGNTPAPPQRHRGGRPRADGSKPPKIRGIKHPSVHSPDLAASLRALQAIDLVVAGHTYAEAARLAGYASAGACHNAVQRELARYAVPKVEAMRKIHFLRIEQLYKVYHAKALRGDGWAAGRALDQLARQAKLMDLDITPAESLQAMPYQKRIVLEDQPAIPAAGEIVE